MATKNIIQRNVYMIAEGQRIADAYAAHLIKLGYVPTDDQRYVRAHLVALILSDYEASVRDSSSRAERDECARESVSHYAILENHAVLQIAHFRAPKTECYTQDA
jgi:hypothetical protein